MDWEDSQSSTEEATEQNDNFFSDSELYAALEEYHNANSSRLVRGDKRRKQSPDGLISLGIGPKAAELSLKEGLLILPHESVNKDFRLQTLNHEENFNCFSNINTMVNTQDVCSTSDVISTSRHFLLEKKTFPLKEKLLENIQSPILVRDVSESQNHKNAIPEDPNQLEAGTDEDSDYEPGGDLESNIPFDGDAHAEKKTKERKPE